MRHFRNDDMFQMPMPKPSIANKIDRFDHLMFRNGKRNCHLLTTKNYWKSAIYYIQTYGRNICTVLTRWLAVIGNVRPTSDRLTCQVESRSQANRKEILTSY